MPRTGPDRFALVSFPEKQSIETEEPEVVQCLHHRKIPSRRAAVYAAGDTNGNVL